MNDYDVMTPAEFALAYSDTLPGQHLVYFIGHLAEARAPHTQSTGLAIGRIARQAAVYAENHGDHLVQKRLKDGRYEYRIVKRRPNEKPTTPALKQRLEQPHGQQPEP